MDGWKLLIDWCNGKSQIFNLATDLIMNKVMKDKFLFDHISYTYIQGVY